MIEVISTRGTIVPGKTQITAQETRWTFVPESDWLPGSYALQVQTTLEDLAGNNPGKLFEVDLFEPVQPRIIHGTVKVAFEVK